MSSQPKEGGEKEGISRKKGLETTTAAEDGEEMTEREIRLRKRQKLSSSETSPKKSVGSKTPRKKRLRKEVTDNEDSDDDAEQTTSEDEEYDGRNNKTSNHAGERIRQYSNVLASASFCNLDFRLLSCFFRVHHSTHVRESSNVESADNKLATTTPALELPLIEVSSYNSES